MCSAAEVRGGMRPEICLGVSDNFATRRALGWFGSVPLCSAGRESVLLIKRRLLLNICLQCGQFTYILNSPHTSITMAYTVYHNAFPCGLGDYSFTPAGERNTWFRPRERVHLRRRVHGVGGGRHRPGPPGIAHRRSPSPHTGRSTHTSLG